MAFLAGGRFVTRFFCLFVALSLFDLVFQIDGLRRPKSAVFAAPAIVDHLDRRDIKKQLAGAALLSRNDQFRIDQDLQVFHHGNPTHVKVFAQVLYRAARRLFDQIHH